MKLNDLERAMLAGESGPALRAAIEHQIKVGDFFGAEDFVPVTQAHIMADTESLGESGVAWLEKLAAEKSGDRTVRIPIRGRAESLNLSAAAAVCLYASARAMRESSPP